jgi:hypothetical protein
VGLEKYIVSAKFYDGKFIGWRSRDDTDDLAFPGMVCISIRGCQNEASDL